MKMGRRVVQSSIPRATSSIARQTPRFLCRGQFSPDSSAMATARREQAATRRGHRFGDARAKTHRPRPLLKRCLTGLGAGYEGDDEEVRNPGQQVDDEPYFIYYAYNRAVNASVLWVAPSFASHLLGPAQPEEG